MSVQSPWWRMRRMKNYDGSCIGFHCIFRWRWPFWSRQEEWSSADNGPPPAAGQRISADSRGCRPAGQSQHSRCALCSGWIPTSAIQQFLLHHLHTWEHPRRTAVSWQNTQELKFHISTCGCTCFLPLGDISMGLERWIHCICAHTFSAGCGSADMSLTPTDWFSSTKFVTFPLNMLNCQHFFLFIVRGR